MAVAAATVWACVFARNSKPEQCMNRWQSGRSCMIAAAMALLATAGAGAAGDAAPAAAMARSSAEFKRLDVNEDGYVTREEARSVRGFESAFKDSDENHDGKLDAAEFDKAQVKHNGQNVSDSMITAKVKAALLKDPVVSAFVVAVETKKGIVQLSGFVRSSSQVRRAAEIAYGVQGVVTVRNALTIKT
jgi:hyperosmotically inducible periplasmic protein